MEREAPQSEPIGGRDSTPVVRALLLNRDTNRGRGVIAFMVVAVALLLVTLITYLVSSVQMLRELDWMELLIVPLVLTTVGFGFNWALKKHDARVKDREMAVASERAQYEVLIKCIEQTKNLLLEHDLRRKQLETGRSKRLEFRITECEESKVARACVLAAFRHLDKDRTRSLLLFLCELHLLRREEKIVDLFGADLQDVDLSECQGLSNADLNNTVMARACLRRANLENVDLTRANLTQADLTDAVLTGADLTGADLRGAVGLTSEQLEAAVCDVTTKIPGLLR